MPTAEIITIGTELLLGEIQDTNTRYLARALRDLGIDLYRTTTIGDNEERIARVIEEALGRCQIIITTGGLGPTVDDPTRQAVARALGVPLEFRNDLWEQISNRILTRYGRQPSTNNMRQAWIPAGSIPIPNPVGTAPAFIGERGDACVISLPGVPREMEYLYQNAVVPYLKQRYHLTGVIKARVLHTAGVGESQIDEWIGDLETLSNPTVGLLAHPGQCDIRITAKANSQEEADQMIAELEATIRQRCGDSIYGTDNETLEDVVFQKLARQGWKLAVFESGLNGALRERLQSHGMPPEWIAVAESPYMPKDLETILRDLSHRLKAEVVLGVCLIPEEDKQSLTLLVLSPSGMLENQRSYGGPPQLAASWAIHSALDFLRRNLPTPLEEN
ncbi:MAG TPA: competence/damage-inducible protein A [Anaerolinea thermolimosa]|uniref:CinA-like protein n=1 Tax=Anaerolinea thermolimosa TaxID=229919 RepID=A0A3D1JK64_9CHLR|nr:CinA family nicotinamide mononucleotide deamidase-related protein [Anaerolinea thermolimosa]GAP07014.1 protein containg molybdenum cofactor synthesis domain [Anaerolinea thermolimosa]HCE18138.1 competence/damage-inducible protein A [Anaerolinea thermolimosa]